MGTNIKVAIIELHEAFYNFNKKLFSNMLPEPAILIQNKGNKKNLLGWCSISPIWYNNVENEKKYEINIVAEYLNRDKYEIMSTLLHEMIHLHNMVNGIKDTTRNYTYHNKNFKYGAEAHGLIVTHDKRLGWSFTKLSESTKRLVDSFDIKEEAFYLARKDFSITGSPIRWDDEGEEIKKKSSSKKYVCPSCGIIVRATKDVNILCIDCDDELVLEDE